MKIKKTQDYWPDHLFQCKQYRKQRHSRYEQPAERLQNVQLLLFGWAMYVAILERIARAKEGLFPRVEYKSMTIYIRDRLVSFSFQMFPSSNTSSLDLWSVLSSENAEGPVIQKQQYKREGYQHRFRHQAQGQKTEGTKKNLRNPDIQHNNCTSHGEHPEESGRTSLRLLSRQQTLHERMYPPNTAATKALARVSLSSAEYKKKGV